MNIEQLTKRKRELCGKNISVPCINVKDDLAAVLKLSTEHKQVTPESILITKMRAALPYVSQELKPFAQAILKLYETQAK